MITLQLSDKEAAQTLAVLNGPACTNLLLARVYDRLAAAIAEQERQQKQQYRKPTSNQQ